MGVSTPCFVFRVSGVFLPMNVLKEVACLLEAMCVFLNVFIDCSCYAKGHRYSHMSYV